MSKEAVRERVWRRLEAAGAVRFPGRRGGIPLFVGMERAAHLLRELPMWKRARVVAVTTEPPLLPLRRAVLQAGKVLCICRPDLRDEHPCIEIDPRSLRAPHWRAASVTGAARYGRKMSPFALRPVDLLIVGSVAVTRQGARLGGGGGIADLEYAVLRHAMRVREYTPILTLAHPFQVVQERIPMRAHDVPADFLVLPDQIIAAPSLYPRPRGIIPSLLRKDVLEESPVLRGTRRKSESGDEAPHRR